VTVRIPPSSLVKDTGSPRKILAPNTLTNGTRFMKLITTVELRLLRAKRCLLSEV
jgi:hypothetical protein